MFQSDESALRLLLKGTSLKNLTEDLGYCNLLSYLNFFDRNGYFDPVDDSVYFTRRIRADHNRHCRHLTPLISADLEKKVESHTTDPKGPWSTYPRPPGVGEVEVSLLITDLCNLQCRYCHVIDNIDPQQSESRGNIMTFDTLEAFTHGFFAYIKERFGIGCLKVTFFGGQPALSGKVRRFLFQAAEYISRQGAEHKIYVSFSIDDNGTQIDEELIDFYNYYGFQVNISYDAPVDVNTIQRPFPGGISDSGPIVEAGIRQLVRKGADVGIRATVSNLNHDRILEAVQESVRWGVRAASFIPMQDVAHGKRVGTICKPEPQIFKEELIKTFDYVLELYRSEGIVFELGPVTALIDSIIRGGTIQSCGMGDVYFAVAPDGDVYTCHRDLIPHYRVVSVRDRDFVLKMNQIPMEKTCPSFHSFLNPDSNCSHGSQCSCKDQVDGRCDECEVLLFCGGSCPGASLAQYGCYNYGASILLDSDPELGKDRCRSSKELIKYFFWMNADSTEDSLFRRYCRALFGDGI